MGHVSNPRFAPSRILLALSLTMTVASVASAASPAAAGTVEVLLRDGDGRPVAETRLHLEAYSAAGGRPRVSRSWYAFSDREGRASFADLAPATYLVRVHTPPDPDLVPPGDNPLTPPPVITLAEGDDLQRVAVELHRGVRVRAFLDLPVADCSGFQAVFRHLATGTALTAPFPRDRSSVERLLVPGVWELSMTPRPGFLLVAVERDRVAVDGDSVTLDLLRHPRSVDVTWRYSAPATLYGVVVEEGGREPTVTVEATLLRPGPWIEAARRRGGSTYDRVTAAVDVHTGRYEMVVPDGEWRVRPASPLLVESRPESLEPTLEPGDATRADFTVRLADGAGRKLTVQVTEPGGLGVGAALVAAFPLGDETAAPVATATTNRIGYASLEGIGVGEFLLVAGHPSYLEGRFDLNGYDPDDPPPATPRIVLPPGAEIFFEVRDVDGRPLAGVGLAVERLGDPPPARLPEEEVPRARRSARSDQSGRARLHGFYPGSYRLTASRPGSLGRGSWIHLRRSGGDFAAELEVELGEGERAEVEGRQLPAAAVAATVLCADGGPLPESIAVRVVDVDAPLPADPTGRTAPGDGVVLAVDDLLLEGRRRDRLVAGPLATGVYRLAVRPAGFDRWSWAFGSHDPREATEVQVTFEGRRAETEVDLGELRLECAPAVDLLPAVAGGAPFPDLAEVEVAARLLDPETDRELGGRTWSTAREGRIELRGLTAGKARLVFTLAHPHLLPEPTLEWEIPVELERGRLVELVPEVEALGGAVELRGIAVPEGGGELLAVAAGVDDWRREAPVEVGADGGRAILPSLVPGTYRIRVDSDAGGEAVAVWEGVEVRPGVTVRLGLHRDRPDR